MSNEHDDLFVADTDPAIDATIDAAGTAGDLADLADELAATLRRLQRDLERGDTDLRVLLESDVVSLVDRIKHDVVGAYVAGGTE